MSEPTLGAICHVEIPAPDLDKAMSFYRVLFGWKMELLGETYAMFQDGGMGGGLDKDMTVSDGGMNLYITVEDIPKKLGEVVEHGGAVVKDETEIGGGYGFYALFKDPNGNRLGLWRTA